MGQPAFPVRGDALDLEPSQKRIHGQTLEKLTPSALEGGSGLPSFLTELARKGAVASLQGRRAPSRACACALRLLLFFVVSVEFKSS